jgi:large subunit ribosomal protein L6
MSRVANAPITVPSGVDVKIDGSNMVVKGKLGELSFGLHEAIKLDIQPDEIKVSWDSEAKKRQSFCWNSASIN